LIIQLDRGAESEICRAFIEFRLPAICYKIRVFNIHFVVFDVRFHFISTLEQNSNKLSNVYSVLPSVRAVIVTQLTALWWTV